MSSADEVRVTISSLDYIPPRNYVRLVLPIPLKPGVDEKLVFDELHEALHKTFIQEPWASGKVFRQSPDTPGWRPGQLELRYRATQSLSDPRPHQLRYHKPDTDWTYEELRDSGFPSDAFPEEELLLDAPFLGDADGPGADIMLTQASFLPGGLLLALTVSHSATDASGMMALFNMWAENFRELHGRDAGGRIAPSVFTDEDRDRSVPDRILEKEASPGGPKNSFDDPWLRGLVCLDRSYPREASGAAVPPSIKSTNGHKTGHTNGSSTNSEGRTMLNRIMFLSATDLIALQKDCAAEPSLAGTPPLSVGDVITALMWRMSMKVRSAAAIARGSPLKDEISVFEAPVDVRNVFSQNFPPRWFGNCWLLNTARMPLAELIDPATTIGRVAGTIRQGAARLDTQAVHDAYTLLRSTDDLSQIVGRFVERPDSSDFLVSNIMLFPLGDISLGDQYFENGGTPQALRVLHGQYAPHVRLGHILPRSTTHGGVELSVNLFDDEMALLEEDEDFNRYLVPIQA